MGRRGSRQAEGSPAHPSPGAVLRPAGHGRAGRETCTVQTIIQAFRIGDLGIVSIPFEVFTETGLDIKARSPFKNTFTIELANGSYGYLPTSRHLDLGGYETWLGTNRIEREASEKIAARALEMLQSVRREP